MPVLESCLDRKKLVFSVGFKLLQLLIDPGYALFWTPQKFATFFKAPQRKSDLAQTHTHTLPPQDYQPIEQTFTNTRCAQCTCEPWSLSSMGHLGALCYPLE